MLGDLNSISETKFLTRKKEDLANNKIINCTFEYADGVGLKMTGNKLQLKIITFTILILAVLQEAILLICLELLM